MRRKAPGTSIVSAAAAAIVVARPPASPVSSWSMIRPSEYRSARRSIWVSPAACSGATYPGDPATSVNAVRSRPRARPKSPSTIVSSAASPAMWRGVDVDRISTFVGLMSRWR